MARLLLISAALIALLGGAARAADLPIGAPVYAPTVFLPFSWSGFYLGLNLGGHWSNDRISTTTDAGGGFGAAGAAGIDGVTSGTLNTLGLMGGFQAGYNWQFGPAVVGIESDANFRSGTANRTANIPAVGTPPAGPGVRPGDFFTNTSKQPLFLMTVRPRLGWAFDHGLVYVTAGYALGTYQVVDSYGYIAGLDVRQADFNARLSGWTAGAGFEYAFARGVSAKVEYLYVGLGSFNNTIVGPLTIAPANIAVRHNYSDNIFRLGVNFHPTW
jgi:outer membrane immunogenic protein